MLIALGTVLGLGLITIGIVRFNNRAMVPQGAVAQPEMKLSRLVTAAKPIERGQLIKASDLKATLVFGAPPAHSIVTPAQAIGRIATVDIQPQQLILSSLVSSDPSAAGLAMLVPVGQRVISIDTTDEIAVGGFLRPGDTVDIEIVLPSEALGGTSGVDRSESHTLLQNIKVLTVGPTLSEADPKAKDADAAAKAAQQKRSLTLAMAPEQVGQLTLARKIGRFFLVLRNPRDEAIVPPGRTTLTGLRNGEAPREAITGAPQAYSPAPRRQPAAQPRPVELIVGGERQIIYSGGR
ncbi:Flp pilus assembly protein CpaB [Sphingomonas turrisvirgatae]|nr:Flp pilus assembly protein CpaB [Sphingomonas turrisvirgatae]